MKRLFREFIVYFAILSVVAIGVAFTRQPVPADLIDTTTHSRTVEQQLGATTQSGWSMLGVHAVRSTS